ncbi:glycoside hydrolase [Rhodanobacter sp. 115]|nr:glycoside hydrolase [Rhodanobacter sp. 115]
MYCTGDPLNANDVNGSGGLNNHLIPTYRSVDLIHWKYLGDAFQRTPQWVGSATDQLWAPVVKHFNGRYYLYYVAPNTLAGGSAIGVATSDSPAGPWTDSGSPVLPPENNPYNGSPGRAVIDPDVVQGPTGQRYISYGSFDGGISIRKLSADGLHSDASSEKQLAVDNYFEGGSFFEHAGYYYLFLSTSSCCNGPLSGYGVRVGRARTPEGPFLDQNGVALNSFDPGGEVAIAPNGNKWAGPGGNMVFTDDAGHDYMLYHAINRKHPYFKGFAGFTRRPVLIDRIEWIKGWPQVRAGRWASTRPQPAPAAQPWQLDRLIPDAPVPAVEPGKEIAALSDEFDGGTLSHQWHFIHPGADNSYVLAGGAYQVATHGPDENSDAQGVSILGEAAPAKGDWMVETKLTSSVPFDDSCCYNFAQGALFIYFDDQNSIKLDVFPEYDTRQSEFGKQMGPVPAGYPTYDHQSVGPVGPTTWLRIVMHETRSGDQDYTAYTSPDGQAWTKGGTWRHLKSEAAGAAPQIGIAAQNTAGFTMDFDYVRVYRLSRNGAYSR